MWASLGVSGHLLTLLDLQAFDPQPVNFKSRTVGTFYSGELQDRDGLAMLATRARPSSVRLFAWRPRPVVLILMTSDSSSRSATLLCLSQFSDVDELVIRQFSGLTHSHGCQTRINLCGLGLIGKLSAKSLKCKAIPRGVLGYIINHCCRGDGEGSFMTVAILLLTDIEPLLSNIRLEYATPCRSGLSTISLAKNFGSDVWEHSMPSVTIP
jgi:hypothetical protein